MKINILEYLAVFAAATLFGCLNKRLILVRLRWENGMWQSEDPATGSVGNLLAIDIPPILENWLAQDGQFENALANGVTMTLSPFRFPGATHCLERTGHELGITWYRDSDSGKVSGLGPDLLRYWFPPPPKLWVHLDAIWPKTVPLESGGNSLAPSTHTHANTPAKFAGVLAFNHK
jgi:hypothetical protein